MKYEIIKDCMISGKQCKIGTVVELTDEIARTLMAIGRVVPYEESTLQNRSVGLESSEDKPKRRGRKPKVEESDVDGI